jgi:hypothetical protein
MGGLASFSFGYHNYFFVVFLFLAPAGILH